MTNLKILIKNDFRLLLGVIQGKKHRKSVGVAISMLCVAIIVVYGLYTFQTKIMFDELSVLGLNNLVLFHGIMTTVTVLLIFGVMRVSGFQKFNDTELLMSLPIKKRDIVIAKTLNRYIYDLFFAFVFLSPFVILYQVYTRFNFAMTVFAVILVLILPLLSVGISFFCDYFITRFFNKLKNARLYKSLFSVSILVLILCLLLIKTLTYGNVNIFNIEAYFADRPIINAILKALLFRDWVSIAMVCIITIFPFALGMGLFSQNYGKNLVSYQPKFYNLKFNENKGELKSLFLKELNVYFTTPAYISNTIIGPILILVLAVVISIIGVGNLGAYFGFSATETQFYPLIIGAMFCFCCATASISCNSISLEGKQFWIIKSSPINENVLFLSKAMVNLVVVCPFIIISTIIVSVVASFNLTEFLVVLFLPLIFTAIISFGGVLVNLLLPKMEWDEEVKVVKQSLSTLISLFAGFFIAPIPIGILFIFSSVKIVYVVLISFAVYLTILTTILLFLFTKGKKLLIKIN